MKNITKELTFREIKKESKKKESPLLDVRSTNECAEQPTITSLDELFLP